MDWEIAATAPGEIADPRDLERVHQWQTRTTPDDAHDWWYRTTFDAGDRGTTLRFDGLATIAQVWLNGALILESSNMFVRHDVDVREQLQPRNELVICCRSLDAALAQKRPRPRWKTRLVTQQQLRWFRTSLVGRMRAWPGPAPIVGPWREVALVNPDDDVSVRAYLVGDDGIVEVRARRGGSVACGEVTATLEPEADAFAARLLLRNPRRWWPHTHGEPALHRVTVGSTSVDVAFRTIEVDREGGAFTLRVNGVPLFCRGACWTPGESTRTLRLAQHAGANMIRVGGTMPYEDDAFYRACDELGILVWQDFAFANMDYPVDDPEFRTSVQTELRQQIARLRAHPCVAVWCGNSEVEQQAAMIGMPRELWTNELFAETIPRALGDDAVYVASTPTGGTLPFHPSTGLVHYYGIGAYHRPVSDARRARIRFAPECLGFANVPERELLDAHPDWRSRTPGDVGVGWDFEDVRDHYVRTLFGVDPLQRRAIDPRNYLDLARVTTGEVMAQTYAEWRSAHSTCDGALVWFLRDLWPADGWGILDSRGLPKACFYYLRRAWQPRTVAITDEGLNGLHVHAINERDEPLHATLELLLLRDNHVVIAEVSTPCDVAPRSLRMFEADALLGAFYDSAYAYRFGPPSHDVAVATLREEERVIAEAFHFTRNVEPKRAAGASVSARAERSGDEAWDVTLRSDRFLYAAHLDVPHFVADDNYFHLLPGREKRITLRGNAPRFRGFVEALNLGDAVPIQV